MTPLIRTHARTHNAWLAALMFATQLPPPGCTRSRTRLSALTLVRGRWTAAASSAVYARLLAAAAFWVRVIDDLNQAGAKSLGRR
jgi:hypothetical protein